MKGPAEALLHCCSVSVCFLVLKVIPPLIFKLDWALSRICMALTLFSAVLNKNSPTFCVCLLVLHSCNNKPCKPFMRIQRRTERGGHGQTVSMSVSVSVCVWLVSTDSFVLNYSISSLWSPEFPRGPTHFFHRVSLSTPYLLLSLMEKAQMLNLSRHAHTKNTRHSRSIYPPSTPSSFIFVAF